MQPHGLHRRAGARERDRRGQPDPGHHAERAAPTDSAGDRVSGGCGLRSGYAEADGAGLMGTGDRGRGTNVADSKKSIYGPEDWSDGEQLGQPGEFPFARGVYPAMYTGRLWTMRQYAGFGTAEETNARFRHLLAAGQSGLSTAFDLPTQMGFDSDHPMADGEVGRVGVAVDTVEDLHDLFREIPLGQVSTSMTINATAAILLAMYVVVGEEQGVRRDKLQGTVQNDVLKEYIARGTYIYPAEPSLRLAVDLFRFVADEKLNFN